MMEHVEHLAGSLAHVDPGSMYRLLRSMELQGLVTSTWVTSESGPSRRVYHITAAGLDVLDAMATSLARQAEKLRGLAERGLRTAQEAREK